MRGAEAVVSPLHLLWSCRGRERCIQDNRPAATGWLTLAPASRRQHASAAPGFGMMFCPWFLLPAQGVQPAVTVATPETSANPWHALVPREPGHISQKVMTINNNWKSTGSRDLLNMCHKAIRYWISPFKRCLYLASRFRAAKTWKEPQTSHHSGCSCPVLSEGSSSIPHYGSSRFTLLQAHFLPATLGRQDSRLSLGSAMASWSQQPGNAFCKGTSKCLQTCWFCFIRKKK